MPVPPTWMIDELAHAGPEHLDAACVAGYDRKQGSIPDDDAAADVQVLRAQGLDAASTVLDLGAGTSQAVDDPTVGSTQEDYAEHIRTEHSTFRWLLEPMLESAGFEIVDADFRTVFGAYTCVKR